MTNDPSDTSRPRPDRRPLGLVAALGPELGPFRGRPGADAEAMALVGVSVREQGVVGGVPLVTALSGVGKVRAAHAAAALLAHGVRGLLVVGTCGALDPRESVGDLLLAHEAVQWDLAVRDGRRLRADPALADVWAGVVPEARRGTLLTADRPALGPVDRRRRAWAARRGLAVPRDHLLAADMETAAVAAVAGAAGVPWAALRVVSDRPVRIRELLDPDRRSRSSFLANFARVAPRPAESVEALCAALPRG